MPNLSAACATAAAQIALALGGLCCAVVAFGYATSAAAEATRAIAMHGSPAMASDFAAAPYANPDAPKGGRLVQGVLGTFDSLNPLIVKGLALPATAWLRVRKPDGARL